MITDFPKFLFDKPEVYPCPERDTNDLHALFLKSIPYRKKETRVFGYFGLPKGDGMFPSVLLLHGGGGTAFPQWVKLWNAHGYAALALDLEGHIPIKETAPALAELSSHDYSGPDRQGEFADVDKPVSEQWMYHAMAAGIVGISFLRNQPLVDATRIGMHGISWGGIVTTNLLCIEERIAFALPTYGCGFLNWGNTYFSAVYSNEKVDRFWNYSDGLKNCNTPTFWLNGGRDFHFPPNATSASCAAVNGSSMLIIPDLSHGYDGAAWEVNELFAFADSICGYAPPFPSFSFPFDSTVLLPDGIGIANAEQWITENGIRYPEPQRTCETVWKNIPIEIDRLKTVSIPAGALSFVNITDTKGRRVSSPLFQK